MNYQLAIWAVVITLGAMCVVSLAVSKFLDWLAIQLDERARRIKREALVAHKVTPRFYIVGQDVK